MKREIVIGSRESKLAVIQSNMVRDYIHSNYADMDVRLLTMKTTGDKILDRSLDQVGGKGLFVKELDRALIRRESDLSVHSLKDMPMETAKELPIIGYSRREDPRDVFILPKGQEKWSADKPIGCSSLRRTIQLQKLFPEAEFAGVRGNVITRLDKLDAGEYSALVLAAAGMKRLRLEERISRYFTVEEVLPAAGQGILCVQGREGESYDYMEGFFDIEATYAATAERAFVRELNGGCSSPVAAYAKVESERLSLTGLYYEEESGKYRTDSMEDSVERAEEMGRRLAQKLSGRAAHEVLL